MTATTTNANSKGATVSMVVYAEADHAMRTVAEDMADLWGVPCVALSTYSPYPTNRLARQARLLWETLHEERPALVTSPQTPATGRVIVASSGCNGHLFPPVASWLSRAGLVEDGVTLLTSSADADSLQDDVERFCSRAG